MNEECERTEQREKERKKYNTKYSAVPTKERTMLQQME